MSLKSKYDFDAEEATMKIGVTPSRRGKSIRSSKILKTNSAAQSDNESEQ